MLDGCFSASTTTPTQSRSVGSTLKLASGRVGRMTKKASAKPRSSGSLPGNRLPGRDTTSAISLPSWTQTSLPEPSSTLSTRCCPMWQAHPGPLEACLLAGLDLLRGSLLPLLETADSCQGRLPSTACQPTSSCLPSCKTQSGKRN